MKIKSWWKFFFLISFSILAEDIQIVFSHSLNGNLLSCPCAIVPIAGLSRRASFIQKNFSLKNTIFIELGNFFSNSDSFEKRKAILEAFESLEYSALVPSSNEWTNLTLSEWKEYNHKLILLSNVKEKGIFFNKNIFKEKETLIKNGKKFLILSFLSEVGFLNFPSGVQKDYEFISPKNYIQKIKDEEKFDYTILILVGDLENFQADEFSVIKNKIFFLAPFKKTLSKNGELLNPKFGKVYTTSGNFGNELGILKLKNNMIHSQTILLDVNELEDAPLIQKLAEKYKIKE